MAVPRPKTVERGKSSEFSSLAATLVTLEQAPRWLALLSAWLNAIRMPRKSASTDLPQSSRCTPQHQNHPDVQTALTKAIEKGLGHRETARTMFEALATLAKNEIYTRPWHSPTS